MPKISKTHTNSLKVKDQPYPEKKGNDFTSKNLSKEERAAMRTRYSSRNQHFAAELSPGSRASCKGCAKKILSGELRFRHVTCSNRCCKNMASMPDTCGRWHTGCLLERQMTHAKDFIHTDDTWQNIDALNKIIGCDLLAEKDQMLLQQAIDKSLKNEESLEAIVAKK